MNQEEIDACIVQADELIKNDQIEEAIEVLEQAKSAANEIDWQERVVQITRMIEDIRKDQEKKAWDEEKRKRQEDDLRKKQEEQTKLEQARIRIDQKKGMEKQQKMDALKKKKELEQKLSTEAYNLLESGSKALLSKDYETCLSDFKKALEDFQTINWPAEVERVQELIGDAEAKYQTYQERTESEATKTQEVQQKFQEYESKVEEDEALQEERNQELKQRKVAKQDKESFEREMSEQAFALIDEGNKLVSDNDFITALEKFHEAKEIFEKIEYSNEMDKVLIQINHTKEKQKRYEQDQKRKIELTKKRQEEDQELEKKADASKRLQERKKAEELDHQRKETEVKDYAQSIAENIFAQIEEIEKNVKEYDADVKKGKILSLVCPYEEAIEIYQKGQTALRDIGWLDQSQRLGDGVLAYEEKLTKDKKLREFEQRRIDKKREEDDNLNRQIQASQRLKKKAEEQHQQTLQLERQKQEQENEVHEECLQLLDNAKNLIAQNQYLEAIAIYQEVIQKYQEIEWTEGVHVTEETLNKTQQDYEDYQRKIQNKQDSIEEQARQQQALEEQIQQSQEETERHHLEAEKHALEQQMKSEKQQQLNDQLLETLDQANQFVTQDQYDEALESFDQALKIVQLIDWPLKQQQIFDTITDVKKKKANYLKKIAAQEERRQKEEEEKAELESRIANESLEREKKASEARQMIKQQKTKSTQEKTLGDEAWKLLDSAENAVKLNKFYVALHLIHKAIVNFTLIAWSREATTTQARLAQVNKMTNPTLIVLAELPSDSVLDQEEELFSDLNEMMFNRKIKEFEKAMDALHQAKQLLENLPMSKSYDAIIEFEPTLQKEQKEFQDEQTSEEELPTKDSAMRVMDAARKHIAHSEFDDGIQLAEKAAYMFSQMGWDKEAGVVNSELVKWRHQKEKSAADQKITMQQPKQSEFKSEEDKRKALVEERAKRRREERKKD